MSKAERRYRETHDAGVPPLSYLHDLLRSGGTAALSDAEALAQTVGLPAATVRGVLSFYTDLHSEQEALQVCHGTSCALAGADAVHAALQGRTACRSVYCLGYCDRSPAVLHPRDGVLCGEDVQRLAAGAAAPAPEPAAPPIRCLLRTPIVTRRLMRGDFSGLEAARGDGAYDALAAALRQPPEAVLDALERSGERGRGGAGFPTGAKWRLCTGAPGDLRYVVANGEEGDPGSFIDRVLMESDPHGILEGLALCGFAVGAGRGIVFIRSEYPRAIAGMQAAVAEAYDAGILGSSVLGSSFSFEVSVFAGLGSYVCGEETAMLNAVEGLRGEVRLRPPYPTREGLYGRPTVVNNVETLVNVPFIVAHGPEAYAALGTPDCTGTKALCLNHGFARPGVVEVEFGTPLHEVVEEAGGGAGGRRLEAVLLGGPMGSLLTPDVWDVPVCYAAMRERGIELGHGGLVALPEGTDYRALLDHLLHFMTDESCGKCTPCRLGSRQARNVLQDGRDAAARSRLERLFDVMEAGSLCAFGQSMPGPMRQMVEHFGDRIFNA